MRHFSVAPPQYRKLLVMLRHLRRGVSLGSRYLRTQGHLIPWGAEIWDFNPETGSGYQLPA